MTKIGPIGTLDRVFDVAIRETLSLSPSRVSQGEDVSLRSLGLCFPLPSSASSVH